jgi:hypothetical protein
MSVRVSGFARSKRRIDITTTVEQAERAYDRVLDYDRIVVVGDRSSCH